MNNDLIERYLYAVTKRMNPKIRADVKQELHGLIDDMLAERCADSVPTEQEIRAVLTELGSPDELYEKYDEDSKKCLIGQPYYSTYKSVLKSVLIAMICGLSIAMLMLQIVEPQPWLDAVTNWLSTVWDGILSVFAVITLIFASMHQKGLTIKESFSLDDLPPLPEKKQEIPRWECILGICFCVVLLALLLAAPEYLIGYWERGGAVIGLFDESVMDTSWYLILIFGLADIIRSSVRLMEGRYNRKVLITTLITNSIGAVAVILWLTSPNLINPEFVSHVQLALSDEKAFIQNIFLRFDNFLIFVILLALALDTVEAAVKTLKK